MTLTRCVLNAGSQRHIRISHVSDTTASQETQVTEAIKEHLHTECNIEQVNQIHNRIGFGTQGQSDKPFMRSSTHQALGWKDRYYKLKLRIDSIPEVQRMVHEYTRGLCWAMSYYYQGCQLWSWFYPFHCAPAASDFRCLEQVHISWDLGEPFLPFEQHMGVFPARTVPTKGH